MTLQCSGTSELQSTGDHTHGWVLLGALDTNTPNTQSMCGLPAPTQCPTGCSRDHTGFDSHCPAPSRHCTGNSSSSQPLQPKRRKYLDGGEIHLGDGLTWTLCSEDQLMWRCWRTPHWVCNGTTWVLPSEPQLRIFRMEFALPREQPQPRSSLAPANAAAGYSCQHNIYPQILRVWTFPLAAVPCRRALSTAIHTELVAKIKPILLCLLEIHAMLDAV